MSRFYLNWTDAEVERIAEVSEVSDQRARVYAEADDPRLAALLDAETAPDRLTESLDKRKPDA